MVINLLLLGIVLVVAGIMFFAVTREGALVWPQCMLMLFGTVFVIIAVFT
jgi:hypothetical protein